MKCDIKTCQKEAIVWRSKKDNPKLIKDIQFCETHAQVGRLIGAVLNKQPKEDIQSLLNRLVELNKEEKEAHK